MDFYCAKAGLVVELDGGGHYTPEQAEKDTLRTKDLESVKLTVIRICNLDIDRNFRGVCAYKAAMLFDSAPTCKVENIKFCLGDIQNATTYDDLGESATAAVVKQITQENRNEELLSIWKKIAQEESCGGTE